MTNKMNIVDRVVERLKAQPIGDLITQEDLYDIVKEAIPKTFFTQREIKEGYHTTIKPPLIIEAIENVLKPYVQKAVDAWAKENEEQMAVYWKNVLDEGLLEYVRNYESHKATSHLRDVLTKYFQNINDERMKRNEPPMYFGL